MKGKVLGEFILVEPEKTVETKTEAGIIIPATVADQSNRGIVVSISEAIKEPGFLEGDTILFSSYSRDIITIDGKELLLMPIKDAKFVI